MYGSLDVSTSGMIAQRTRMEVIASNIANSGTIENAQGEYEPYLRRAAMLSPVTAKNGAGIGVEVSEIQIQEGSTRPEYRPGNRLPVNRGISR